VGFDFVTHAQGSSGIEPSWVCAPPGKFEMRLSRWGTLLVHVKNVGMQNLPVVPDDALCAIARFCDVDGRRALGCLPNRLVRNVVFDEKLQVIHRGIVVVKKLYGNHGHFFWKIRANNRALLTIVDGGDGGRSWIEYSFAASNSVDASVLIMDDEGARCTVYLGSLLPSPRGYACADWTKEGKWVLALPPMREEKATLCRLGFVLPDDPKF
jgi:hypothetical protein